MKPKTVGRDDGGRTAHPSEDFSGLMATGIILTLNGEMRVRDVRPGDRVITRDAGMAVVRAVRSRRVQTRAVRIRAGSLGHTRPDRDVILPAGQPVLLRDWRAEALCGTGQALVPAHRLVDEEFVTLHQGVAMTLHEIEFDRPHILYVDGLELAAQTVSASIAKAA